MQNHNETLENIQPTALLIEDDQMIQRVYTKMLTRAGLRTIAAYDGAQGLEVLEKEKVDIILLDLGMPGLNGFDTLKRLRGHPQLRDIPVIILTNTTVNEQRAIYGEIQEAGVADILHKYETSLVELTASIKRHLPEYNKNTALIATP